jgi:hypothetical protein
VHARLPFPLGQGLFCEHTRRGCES